MSAPLSDQQKAAIYDRLLAVRYPFYEAWESGYDAREVRL